MLDPAILAAPTMVHGLTVATTSDPQAAVQRAESQTQTLAAALELLSAVDATSSLSEAAELAAEKLNEFFSAGRVIILWRHDSGNRLDVIGDSDRRSQEPADLENRLITAAGEEIAIRGPITIWPPRLATDRHALLAVTQLAKQLSIPSILAAQLANQQDHNRGVVIVLGAGEEASELTDCSSLLSAIRSPMTSRLEAIERMQPGKTEAAVRGMILLAKEQRRRWVFATLVVVSLLMLLPVRYRIAAELELQPVQRRFVAVPFDGPLESSHVRPGDIVEQGDLLARINPREIEYELAGTRAELNRAEQEKKAFMADHDFAGRKIAALESDRLRLQADLLQYQRDNLEIRSPIAGVVVSGDLADSEGSPMTRGETLFEIAPLGTMVVEIAVAESEVGEVRQQMSVEFHVHALPSRVMRGTIDRVHPRSELRYNENVFIAEVQVQDPENVLRPGMRGRARILGDRHAWGWNLFHKAFFATRNLLGW